MSTRKVSAAGKRPGRKPYFTPAIEDEIHEAYFKENCSAADLAKKYGPVARGGTITDRAIRAIAERVQQRKAT